MGATRTSPLGQMPTSLLPTVYRDAASAPRAECCCFPVWPQPQNETVTRRAVDAARALASLAAPTSCDLGFYQAWSVWKRRHTHDWVYLASSIRSIDLTPPALSDELLADGLHAAGVSPLQPQHSPNVERSCREMSFGKTSGGAVQMDTGTAIWQDREIRFDIPPPCARLSLIRDEHPDAASRYRLRP